MEVAIGAQVYDSRGQKAGEVSHVVVDGQTQELTHIVISKGWLLPRDIVVPVDAVEIMQPAELRLRLDEQQLEQQPDFIEQHYVSPEEGEAPRSGYPPGRYLYRPIVPTLG